jgi:short-subunit dehydrogenase
MTITMLTMHSTKGNERELKLFSQLGATARGAGGRMRPHRTPARRASSRNYGQSRLVEFLRCRDGGISSARLRSLFGARSMIETLPVICTSLAIATAVARLYAVRDAAEVETWVLDANDIVRHADWLDAAWRRFDGVDHALVAQGVLLDQAECQASVTSALASFDTNARLVLALLTDLANRFERQGSGAISVISSTAGDRGRASNYVYRVAKAAVTNLASGLRDRLAGKGERVVTILPDFVDTPMTASFPKGPLLAAPEKVAADIYRALVRGFGAVYTPWLWRWVMLLFKHVPEHLFIRTKL